MASNNFVAGGTINPSCFVKLSTSADNTVLQATAGDLPYGITGPSTKYPPIYSLGTEAADTGDPVTVFDEGEICLLVAGSGGWTHGDLLKSDANGNGVTASSGDYIGAFALATTPAGALGRVQIVIFKN